MESLISKDHMTNDAQYNNGLKKLRFYGIKYWDDDVHYYLYCNGIGCWK